MKTYSEKFLKALKKQDTAAFGELYDDFVDLFYRYIKSRYTLQEADVQDILSDIFVKIRHTLPRLDIHSSLSGFLWAIAKNHIIDYFKLKKDISFWTLAGKSFESQEEMRWEEWLEDPKNFLESFNSSYTHEKIQDAIEQLDEIYKDPLLLKFIEGLSYEEIANTLNISQDTVRQRISRWLKKMANLLSLIK